MARTKSESSVETNGGVPVPTNVHDGGIPARVSRPRHSYAAWTDTIESLRGNLGQSWEFAGMANVQSIAQGLRREFGVLAATRDLVRDKADPAHGSGTLYIEYPSVVHPDGTRSEDNDKVAELKAKYAK